MLPSVGTQEARVEPIHTAPLRDGFGNNSVVLEAGNLALTFGIELDDVGLEEEVEIATDAGHVAVEVVGEGTDGLDVPLADACDKLLALLRENRFSGLSVGDEDVLESTGSKGAGYSGPSIGVIVWMGLRFGRHRLVLLLNHNGNRCFDACVQYRPSRGRRLWSATVRRLDVGYRPSVPSRETPR